MNVKTRTAILTMALSASGAPAALAQTPPAAPAAPAAPTGKVTKPPRLLRLELAPYPASELANPKPASVLLAIGIGADGKVADVTVVDSAGPSFDEAAVAAARGFEFEPAEIDGVPAAVKIQYRYDFTPPAPQPAAAPSTAVFGGRVRDRKTGAPLPGVTVSFDDASTTTDEQGRFRLDAVAPGRHLITLTGPGFTPVGTEEEVEAGRVYDAVYDVQLSGAEVSPEEQVDFEIVVVDTALAKTVASTTVSSDQGARVAGTGGDAIRVVENLPGVARSTVGTGALVVWGAGSADTRTYIDGVRVPVLYHQGGFRSVIHSDLVRSVELEPGGYGAPYGRGLGGLVTVGMKPLEANGYHGSVGVDAIDGAASLRGSIGDKLRFAAAVRRSHLDWVLAHATSQDVGAFVPIPKYWDSQVRLAWVPREGETLEVGGLFSSDHIARSLVEADPADTKSETRESGFERVYVRYERKFEDGSAFSTTPYVGFDRASVSSRFGPVPAMLDNRSTIYGARSVWTGTPLESLQVGTGLDLEVVTSTLRRSGSVTSPPREGDIRVFGQMPSDQVNADDWHTTWVGLAPFAQADLALLSDTLHLIPGLRLEPGMISASRRIPQQGDLPAVGTSREDTHVEPRLAARWALTPEVTVRGAVGLYHQPPLPDDLSAVFGNPLLGPASAMHYVLGTAVHLSKPVTLEATGFLSKQSALVTRNPAPVPVTAQALIQDGRGRAYGGQVLLRRDLTDRFFGWLSYSLLRSERTDGGSTHYRLFDFDQTHVLTALGSYDLGAGFEVGVRLRYATGYPRTPVVRAIADARTDSYQPIFGAHNAIRIPDFYQADARLSKRWVLGAGSEVQAYLDVQNVTDHRNPEEIVYNFDYTRKSYITGLPVLPVVGGKLTW